MFPKLSKREATPKEPLQLLLGALTLILLPVSVYILYEQWDLSLLRAPVCRTAPSPDRKLPKMVVLIGLEGGGHDLFEYLFAALPTAVAIERFDPGLHLTHDPKQESAPADSKTPHKEYCPQFPYARRLHDFGVHVSEEIQEKAGSTGATYIRVRDPMPMGRIRTPLARLDPVSLATFHGLYYDLKAIVLVRNITRSVMWAVSRNFHNEDIGLQLRLLEDSLTYMDASIRTLPCSSYALVDVDWIQSNAMSVAAQLAKFLDLPKVGRVEMAVALQVALTRWDSSLSQRSFLDAPSLPEPTFGGQKVDFFFAQRSGLWPLLHAARNKPLYVPSSPSSWPRTF